MKRTLSLLLALLLAGSPSGPLTTASAAPGKTGGTSGVKTPQKTALPGLFPNPTAINPRSLGASAIIQAVKTNAAVTIAPSLSRERPAVSIPDSAASLIEGNTLGALESSQASLSQALEQKSSSDESSALAARQVVENAAKAGSDSSPVLAGEPSAQAPGLAPPSAKPSAPPQNLLVFESPAGKTLLLIGGKKGRDYLITHALAAAKKHGIAKVLFLDYDDPKQRAYAASLGIDPANYIGADVGNHHPQNITEIAQRLREVGKGQPIHAVKNFLNAYAQLEAEIAHALEVTGNSPEAVHSAHAKSLARLIMNRNPRLRLPFEEVTEEKQVAGAFARVTAEMKAMGLRQLKVVMKPNSGGGGWGVELNIDSPRKALETYRRIRRQIEKVNRENPGLAKAKQLDQMPSVLLEAQIPRGIPFDVEGLRQGREVPFIFPSFNPLAYKGTVERGTLYPALLAPEQRQEIVETTTLALAELGLQGNFHIEGILVVVDTPAGPKYKFMIVELNARMGGGEVEPSILISAGVNLIEQGILYAFNVPLDPKPYAKPRLLQHRFIIPAASGRVISIKFISKSGHEIPQDDFMRENGAVLWEILKEVTPTPGHESRVEAAPDDTSDFLGFVTIEGENERKSFDRLIEILRRIEITIRPDRGWRRFWPFPVRQTAAFGHEDKEGRTLMADLQRELEEQMRQAAPPAPAPAATSFFKRLLRALAAIAAALSRLLR